MLDAGNSWPFEIPSHGFAANKNPKALNSPSGFYLNLPKIPLR
jgi:hypothetical protein